MDVVEDVFEDELVCTVCSELFVKVRRNFQQSLQFTTAFLYIHCTRHAYTVGLLGAVGCIINSNDIADVTGDVTELFALILLLLHRRVDAAQA